MNPNQFNDSIHSQITLPKICAKILNTKHFQRLKKLKQLGGVYFVYPSASHNRYEHCIGTSYLAGVYAKHLQEFLKSKSNPNPSLQITEDEIICVQIAGLCHDLGHGPLSHCWERVMKSITGKNKSSNTSKYNHEDMSCLIFEDIFAKYPEIEKALPNIENENTITIIRNMIKGIKPENLAKYNDYYRQKYFLFQIVANEFSKIDVDKFDYMLRDSKFLNLGVTLDYRRIIHNTAIGKYVKDNQEFNGLTYRIKILHTLEELFTDRMIMHRKAYQHPRNVLVEQMFLDGFMKVENIFNVYCKSGSFLMNEFVDESKPNRIDAFLETTDNIVDLIKQTYFSKLQSEQPNDLEIKKFKEAVDQFDRIENGNHYFLIGYFLVTKNEEKFKQWTELASHLDTFTNFQLESKQTISGYGTKDNYHPLREQQFFYCEENDTMKVFKGNLVPKFVKPSNEIKYLIYSKEKPSLKELKMTRDYLFAFGVTKDNEGKVLFVPE